MLIWSVVFLPLLNKGASEVDEKAVKDLMDHYVKKMLSHNKEIVR